jgi:hypothetical protein
MVAATAPAEVNVEGEAGAAGTALLFRQTVDRSATAMLKGLTA